MPKTLVSKSHDHMLLHSSAKNPALDGVCPAEGWSAEQKVTGTPQITWEPQMTQRQH